MVLTEPKNLRLGMQVYDSATEVRGVLVALTQWFDRSDEGAILRPGVDNDGHPWPLLWVPLSRIVAQGAAE